LAEDEKKRMSAASAVISSKAGIGLSAKNGWYFRSRKPLLVGDLLPDYFCHHESVIDEQHEYA
jgi:hypothetical protein